MGTVGTSQLYLNALSKYPNKLRLLNDGDSPTPGVVIRLAPGHSPGHSIYEFKKGKARLTVIGDLYHLRVRSIFNTLLTCRTILLTKSRDIKSANDFLSEKCKPSSFFHAEIQLGIRLLY